MRLVIGLAVLAGCGRLGFEPTDASEMTDAVPAACGSAGEVFCDNFESSGLSSWSDAPTGMLAWESGIVHLGQGALQAATDGRQPAYVGTSLGATVATGSIHARAWFYVPSEVELNKIDVYSLDGTEHGVVFLIDKNELRAYSAPGGGATVTTGKLVPRNRWFCIELHVGISRTAGAVQLDLDGAPIGAIATGLDTLPGGGYGHLSIGLSFIVRPQAAVTFYIDDIVAGSQPIGCS